MIVSPKVVRDAFEHNSRLPDVQDLASLLAYVYARGHSWADSTSVEDAIHLIGDFDRLDPVLGPILLRLLEHRERTHGADWSVSDVDRVQWYRRRVDSWDRSVGVAHGVAWPGGSAWVDLRISHMRAAGLTVPEISGLLSLSRRAIRKRIRRVSADLGWLVLSPCVALRPGE